MDCFAKTGDEHIVRELLVYVGSVIIFAWGIGHLIPTRSIVGGFGDLTADNRRILTMEWMAEGFTLCFVGALGALVAIAGGLDFPVGRWVLRAAAAMLFVMAGLSAATGAKTSITPMKACPIIKSIVAGLYVAASGMP